MNIKVNVKEEMNMTNEDKISVDAKSVRNAYARAWRAKNKDKVKAANQRYWEKRAAALAAEQKEESK